MQSLPLPLGFSIGGIGTRVRCGEPGLALSVSPDEAKFVDHQAACDVELLVVVRPLPDPEGRLIFDSTGLWRLYETPLGRSLALGGRIRHRLAVMDRELRRGTLYYAPEFVAEESGRRVVDALAHPLLELLTYWQVTALGGLGVHCAGVVSGGRGLLFAGPSGAGKSTLSELWAATGATILSDDRICLRTAPDGTVSLYGTPWHGTADYASAQSAPLERIFFIEHASENWVCDVSGAEAAALILSFSFVPPFDPEMIALCAGAAERITGAVRCQRLGFVPDPSIVDFVRSLG